MSKYRGGWKYSMKKPVMQSPVIIEGSMKPTDDNFTLSIGIEQSFNFYAIDVFNETAGGDTSKCIIRGFTDNLHSHKAAMDAFVKLWNNGKIKNYHFDMPEHRREQMREVYSELIEACEEDNWERAACAFPKSVRKFLVILDPQTNFIVKWAEI